MDLVYLDENPAAAAASPRSTPGLVIVENRATIENPNVGIIAPTVLTASGANINTPFGIITPSVALTLSTVYACARVLAETLASMDLHLMRRTPNGKERATDHKLYGLIADAPNEMMTSYSWRERMILSCLLGGNSYDAIIRDGAGRVVELQPIRFDKIRVGVTLDHKKVFKFDGQVYDNDEFLHIQNVSQDGLCGDSTITFARTSISLGLASEQYGTRLFSQGSASNKWVEIPRKLTDDERKRAREAWAGNYAGMTNAHKVPFLEDGWKLHEIGISKDDMQFLATRAFNVVDICRWFRVPPHKVADLQRSTNNNIEHQAIEFITDTIRPWAVRIEQELNAKLLLPSERSKYFFRFNLDSLLRGDLDSRYGAYALGRQWGFLSPNDIRESEDMNKLPDGQGDIYLDPLNMVPATQFLPGGLQNPTTTKKKKKDQDDDEDEPIGGFEDDGE